MAPCPTPCFVALILLATLDTGLLLFDFLSPTVVDNSGAEFYGGLRADPLSPQPPDQSWRRAYRVPLESGEQMIVGVVLENRSWAETLHGARPTCRWGPVLAASVTFHLDHSEGTAVVALECVFPPSRWLRTSPLPFDSIEFHGLRIPIVRTPTGPAPRLFMCIPTFFNHSPAVWPWLGTYLDYYETHHRMDRIAIYTDDDVLWTNLTDFAQNRTCRGPTCSALTPVHINRRTAALGHYHGQMVALWDCWARALSEGAQWILQLDLDEVMTWPFEDLTWDEVFGLADAFTVASWPYDGRTEEYSAGHCPAAKATLQGRVTDCPHPADRDCCRCRAWRRKYAIRGDPNGARPLSIHQPGGPRSPRRVWAVDPASGVLLKHYSLSDIVASGNATTLSADPLKSLTSPPAFDIPVKLCARLVYP
jgi:hypothetical protein